MSVVHNTLLLLELWNVVPLDWTVMKSEGDVALSPLSETMPTSTAGTLEPPLAMNSSTCAWRQRRRNVPAGRRGANRGTPEPQPGRHAMPHGARPRGRPRHTRGCTWLGMPTVMSFELVWLYSHSNPCNGCVVSTANQMLMANRPSAP